MITDLDLTYPTGGVDYVGPFCYAFELAIQWPTFSTPGNVYLYPEMYITS